MSRCLFLMRECCPGVFAPSCLESGRVIYRKPDSQPPQSMTRRNLLLISIVLWLYVVIGAMLANEYLDLEVLFVLWLIGMAVVIQVATLPYAEPAYLTRQKYLLITGIVVFAHIVAIKILEVLLV
jgi:hypothetical protein